MSGDAGRSTRRRLPLLHLVFALTGVLHAIGGTLLPSLAATFHLTDSQSGTLFLLYFAGSSLGALLCRHSYARTMAFGFVAIALCSAGVATAAWPLLLPVFLFLGISVGVPMSAVSLFAGRAFPERCAPVLTFLNFSWSAGALLAPLLAGGVLMHHSYRPAYLVLSAASVLAAASCFVVLKDEPEARPSQARPKNSTNLQVVIVFAAAAFLQVGIENTAAAWLSTFSMRTSGGAASSAAVVAAVYWAGFLASRGVASLVLLRAEPMRVFRAATVTALAASAFLAATHSAVFKTAAMFLLGIALAPVYPLVVAGSLKRTRQTSDSRWVLAAAGFGGSVLPWLAGWISARSGSLRIGILLLPAALAQLLFLLPLLGRTEESADEPNRSRC
jgi:MFS transporter, FHS family, glucose/mannose:H+ symporter